MRTSGWKYYLAQIVCWLLLLQMVNISIDPPDIKPHLHSICTHKNKAKVNQIETIYELVSESLLDTIIPETDDPELEKTINLVELYFSKVPVQSFEVIQPPLQHQSYYSLSFTSLTTEPTLQPPKQA